MRHNPTDAMIDAPPAADAPPGRRLAWLARGVLHAPPGSGRVRLALAWGMLCHGLFALGVGGMAVAMFLGMTAGFGWLPQPWATGANALLILQFPLVHSLLLGRRGRSVLARLAPAPHGATLATTTYAMIASVQLIALFWLWTPSGIVWWRAEGAAFWALCAAYAGSWLLLGRAIWDGGPELQSGALGWMSLAQGVRPRFPDMPETGLFAVIRQPIYVAFALTLWTVPVWTPDQAALATVLTAYCLLAPRWKERRFAALYGDRFANYRARVPYALPFPRRIRDG